MSEFKEQFLDLLHMTGMAMSSGRHMPSELFLDRDSYQKWCALKEKKRVKWMKKEMERQDLLRIREKGNQLIIEVSEKGKIEALKQEILNNDTELPIGTSCLVSFDIPEVVEKSRKAFRNFLKKAGFKQMHRSVWLSNRNIITPLKQLVQRLEIEDWVRVYQVFG